VHQVRVPGDLEEQIILLERAPREGRQGGSLLRRGVLRRMGRHWRRGYGRLSEAEVEETAARMRADIASGKLSPQSYVTRYSFDTHEVTALVGRVPMHGPAEQRSHMGKETCGRAGGPEVEDPKTHGADREVKDGSAGSGQQEGGFRNGA
jgi:hypothetical protein